MCTTKWHEVGIQTTLCKPLKRTANGSEVVGHVPRIHPQHARFFRCLGELFAVKSQTINDATRNAPVFKVGSKTLPPVLYRESFV